MLKPVSLQKPCATQPAGRALEKHGSLPGSALPKATGNPASKNQQGQYHLDEILTNPNSITIKGETGYKIFARDGRGVFIKQDGSFRGFIELHLE
jgi:hypothetical protein